MNKRYLLLFVGVIVAFIIFVIILFVQLQPQQSQSSPVHNRNASNLQQTSHMAIPTITLAPAATNPKDATQQFYKYYFASRINPLADGAYKDNPYLSQDFKDNIGVLYNNGNAPVLCLKNKRESITVGQEQSVYYNNQYQMQETISDALTGKNLYLVTLENDGGRWLIFDINCME